MKHLQTHPEKQLVFALMRASTTQAAEQRAEIELALNALGVADQSRVLSRADPHTLVLSETISPLSHSFWIIAIKCNANLFFAPLVPTRTHSKPELGLPWLAWQERLCSPANAVSKAASPASDFAANVLSGSFPTRRRRVPRRRAHLDDRVGRLGDRHGRAHRPLRL